MTCPACGGRRKFVQHRSRRVKTLMGPLRYERAYYCGCRCGGWTPLDESLRLVDQLTWGAAEVVTLHGALCSFDEAATKALPRASGLRLSASTVQRITEGIGGDLQQRRQAGEVFGDEQPWEWEQDAGGDRCCYVSLDATGVRQQAADHSRADGRMAWVGAVFNPPPVDDPRRERLAKARYVSGLMSLPELGRQLRHEADSVGMEQADVVIGLCDGGNGLAECLTNQVFCGVRGRVELILDFYHASEHVCDFASLWSDDEQAASEQAHQWCHTLKHFGGEVLLAELEALDVTDRSELVCEEHRRLCGYLGNNLYRTDYPRYQANGWQIGSGTIESACKNVVNGRLNGPGMRWSEPGTSHLCRVRALFKSEPSTWHNYWQLPPRQLAT